jgi:hypothetical protein
MNILSEDNVYQGSEWLGSWNPSIWDEGTTLVQINASQLGTRAYEMICVAKL